MSHFSLTCIEIVKQLIPSIVTDKRVLVETKDYLPKIIYSSIECLSNVDENIYFIGLTILGTICQFLEADEKVKMNEIDIQDVENCRKAIIQCLESTFDQFIEYTISHEENSSDSKEMMTNENQMKPYYFSSYFMSFNDSFIESKVPFLIDTIDQSMDKSSISNVLYVLFDSKPILLNFIIPKILDRLDKAINDKDKKKKKYFSLILSKLCIVSPCFIPFVDEIKKRIDILINEYTLNSFKCVSSLIIFIGRLARHNNLFVYQTKLSNAKGFTINDSEKISQKKWEWLGKPIENLKIVKFQLEDSFIIEQLEYCVQILQKLERIFFQEDEKDDKSSKLVDFKIRKTILIILQVFNYLYESKGQFCKAEPISYQRMTEDNPNVSQIDLHIKKIESIMRNLIIKGLKRFKDKIQILNLIVQLTDKYFFLNKNDLLLNMSSIDAVEIFNCRFKNKGKKIMLYKLVIPYSKSSIFKLSYKTEFDEEIVDLLYEISHTMNTSLFGLSIKIITFFSYIKKVNLDYPLKELQVIETKKRISSQTTLNNSNNLESPLQEEQIIKYNDNDILTQEQCITALTIIGLTCKTKLIYENQYLARILKDIVNLKFDKNWNISKYLFALYNSISVIKFHFDVKDDKIWRDLTNSIIPTSRKSKDLDEPASNPEDFDPSWWMTSHEIFFMILSLISFQNPPVSPKFLKFLINTLFNLYEPNRIGCILSLSNIFVRMKPKTKKIQVNKIPEGSIYDDNCTFYLKNIPGLEPLFTVYEGTSEFDQQDGFQQLREAVFDFFTSEKLGLLIDSLAFFLNEKSQNNAAVESLQSEQLMVIFECFWKGLAMLLRSQFVLLIKDKLIDIALNKSGPLLMIMFTIFRAVWRASKHWNTEEVDLLTNELCIPILRIIFFKRNSVDAYEMLESASFSFISRRNIHRLNWLFDFIMNSIVEISSVNNNNNNGQPLVLNEENENILVHLIDFAASVLFNVCDRSYSEQYIFYLKEIILPAFGSKTDFDFHNHTKAAVSSLAKFCCSFMNTNLILDSLPPWASIPFVEVFDVQFEKKRFDKLALFMNEMLSPATLGLTSFIPFISDRIEQIFVILENLTTKFQNCGSQLILQIGLLHWEKFPDLLLNNVLKKIKDVVVPSLSIVQHGWWIKCQIVTFLHILCFRNLFILPNEVYRMILNEILPLLICEKNENVRESSMSLLIYLVNVVYCGQFDIISKECLESFAKCKENESVNMKFSIATTCALLCNMSTLMNSCPKWLPLIFNELENIYFRGTSFKNVIQKTVKDFWIRHGFREIPDLEEYRFSLCESYYA